jgi:hypothetical protein
MDEPIGLINQNEPMFRDRPDHDPGSQAEPSSDLAPTSEVRSFTGFDLERSTYTRLKSGLIVRAEGQFVVIVGEAIEGPFSTFGDAERAGYRRFGLGPLYIKQVLAEEPVAQISRDLSQCRP